MFKKYMIHRNKPGVVARMLTEESVELHKAAGWVISTDNYRTKKDNEPEEPANVKDIREALKNIKITIPRNATKKTLLELYRGTK